MTDVVYLDASALVKLVLAEPETDALRAFLDTRPRQATSRLGAVEVARAVMRAGVDDSQAGRVLGAVSVIALDALVARAAARLPPASLRAGDAVHLASALELRESLEAFISYDDRLVDAARHHGLPVVTPT